MACFVPFCSKLCMHGCIRHASVHVFKPKRHVSAHDFCKPSSRDTTAGVCPGKWWQPWGDKQPTSPLCRREVLRKSEKGTERSYQVSGKYSRTKSEREGFGFQERHTVISKCFFALSGCLTKAAGEFYWRIRLVAFLWLLTSGGFGLCLESQWSNRHVCHFVEQSIDCGWGNNAFFFPLKRGVVHVAVDHLALVAAVWCSLPLPSFWKHHWRMYVRFHMSSWKEANLLVYPEKPPAKFLYLSPYWIY